MSNGFRYESPINRLLSVTIPRFLDRQLEREQRERISDREFTYRSTQDQLDRTREQERLELEAKKYDAAIIESEDDELYSRGQFQIEQFNLEPNIKKKRAMFAGLDSTDLHSDISGLVTSRISGLDTQLEEVGTAMKEFSSEIYDEGELRRIKNQFILGKPEGGYQVADNILTNRYSTPWVKTESLRIRDEIKSVDKKLEELIGLDTDDIKKRRG